MTSVTDPSSPSFFLKSAGFLLTQYLRWVQRTTDFTTFPMDISTYCRDHRPAIMAMWHGQHFMVPFLKAFGPDERVTALVSRNKDGTTAAIVVENFGVEVIRGSGGRGRYKPERGGASALKMLIRALKSGSYVSLTADPPKRPRHCGLGIITLARLSQCPIIPTAVVCGRSLTFPSWDRSSIGLPYGKGAIVLGNPVYIPQTLTSEEQESYRLAVEKGLNHVHKQAYGLVDSHDPGEIRKNTAHT